MERPLLIYASSWEKLYAPIVLSEYPMHYAKPNRLSLFYSQIDYHYQSGCVITPAT